MLLAFNRSLNSESARSEPATSESDSALNITVVFTAVNDTIAALKKAGAMAESLGGRLTLVVLQIVPFPLPLTSPPVLLEFQEKRFREIASESPVDTTVQLYLCRDRDDTLRKALKPHSLVVIGGRKRFWPTLASRMARQLLKDGHQVILTEEK